MSKRTSLITTAAGVAALLGAVIAVADLTGPEQKCLNSLNKDGSKVSKAQGKENSSCLKAAGKGLLVGTAQACLTADPKQKVQTKKDKTLADDGDNCGSPPSFGYTGGAAVNTAAVQGQIDLVADIFGPNLGAAVISCASNNDGCLCQQKALKDAEKLAAKKLGEFVKCKKQVLKDGGMSAANLVACVNDGGTAGSIAADTKGKIGKSHAKLLQDITDRCTGVSGAFPGECSSFEGNATQLTDCIDAAVECRVCQTINEMDGILVNCDLFDNGLADASCASGAGPTPTPTETPTLTPTATDTVTPTETPTLTPTITPGGPLFAGALLKSTGRFTYSAMIGIPGANTSCAANYPSTHACSFPELLSAESNGDLVGATDTGAVLVTSLWAIDSTQSNLVQCGTAVPWDYQTAHTGHQGQVASLNNGTGDLGPVSTALNCRTTLGRLLLLRNTAASARSCRRRRSLAIGLLLDVCAWGFASLAPAASLAPCSLPGAGWCLARRITGEIPQGEMGFRFGEPLDVDGDGRADLAFGTRFKLTGVEQTGTVGIWSGASGAKLREWDGEAAGGLFGHSVLPLPDLGSDGLADVVISAPTVTVDGTVHGVVVARSPNTGAEIWKRTGNADEDFGWDLAAAGDQNGDGCADLIAGAPSNNKGRAYLLSGRDGATLRTFAPPEEEATFGWYVARVDDLDGDGRPDVAVGAPFEKGPGGNLGGAYVFSSATGEILRHWRGGDDRSGFGEIVASVGDLDGDGRGEVAVAAPRTGDQTRAKPGEVFVYSGGTGKELRHWSGTQAGELYGRMVVSAGDLDGDGADDLAIGAPWHRRATEDRVGHVEFRSGRTGGVLGELSGDVADSWFGWHMRRAPDPEGRGRPALLIGSLRHPVGGEEGTGVIDLFVLRGEKR